jgi:hypothetical protein
MLGAMAWGRAGRRLPIAAAIVLGLVSLATTLARSFRAGLRTGRPAGEPLGRLAGRLALLQVTIYLVQELIERAAAGVPLAGPVHGRLLLTGIAAQLLVAAVLALGLAWAGRVAEVAGRALRARRLQRPDPRPARLRPADWFRPPSSLPPGWAATPRRSGPDPRIAGRLHDRSSLRLSGSEEDS